MGVIAGSNTPMNLGIQVQKSGGTVTTGADDLFTVTGMCLITLMYGEVTTIIAGGTDPELMVNVKDGSNTVIAGSTVITDDAAGTLYMVTGDTGVDFNGGDAPTVGLAQAADNGCHPFIVNDITIESTAGGGTPATSGAIRWTLHYLPLEDGATIVAAA